MDYKLEKAQIRARQRVPFEASRNGFPFPIPMDDYRFYVLNSGLAEELWRYCSAEAFLVAPVLHLLSCCLRSLTVSSGNSKLQLEEGLRAVGEYRYQPERARDLYIALQHCLQFAEIASEAFEASNDNLQLDLQDKLLFIENDVRPLQVETH